MIEQRSTTDQSNLQEELDSTNGNQTNGMQQYATPEWLVQECIEKLPNRYPATVIDPQCFEGALLKNVGSGYGTMRYGIELDNRVQHVQGVNLINGNCMKVWEALDDLFPDTRFVCANANPPFGKKLKQPDGKFIDSTLATWRWVISHANMGFFIASQKTIEELKINTHPFVREYFTKPADEVWKGMRSGWNIGMVIWQNPDSANWTSTNTLYTSWEKVKSVVNEEKNNRPDFNIYLDERGNLKTYLSIRNEVKLKLQWADIQKLKRIDNCHPLTLTTEKETRHLMRDLINLGIYNIQPAAKEAIENALLEVNTLACPIMQVTPFETVAYADEEERLKCIKDCSENGLRLTAGKSYDIATGSYKFTQTFTRNKVHYNEELRETYTKEHTCILSGSDRYIQIRDDNGQIIRFMDRPRENVAHEKDEKLLWEFFDKPVVNTVAEANKPAIKQNMAILRALEMTAGYKYYDPGQIDYLARVGVKDNGLVAAETGTGKSLMAISLIAMKSPMRALIVAPQGTMRATESDDEDGEDGDGEMNAAQWLKELARFAPYMQVFELFSYEDYQRLCSLNHGELPAGVYVSYYEALYSNGAREKTPDTWNDEKLNKWAVSNKLAALPTPEGEFIDKRFWCDSVGREVNGIRCIIEPCLATRVGHHFDCVMLDEAHRACNLGANLTQMLIRMQPKYRFALTATPIPNVIDNLFSLMGWLAVPDWYKGDRLNAAFPYARGDLGRFTSTFRSTERDLTQEEDNRRADPKNNGKCIKDSPIISSPARLLKILKPTMAFISKVQVNKDYIPPKVIDVRVNMGKEQSVLYGHFLDRANIQASNALVRARKQTAYLRNICADPAGFTHGGPRVYSNMNPKVNAILELVRDIVARGEQFVIINSRIGITSTLHDKLCDAGISISRIDSTISAEEHSHQANLFKQRKTQGMLLGIKCAAAWSFDDCVNLIIGSLEFSCGPFVQAKGRIDRVTNKVVKNIYVILHKNSMEEIMFDTVATKDDAATICLRGQRVPRDFKPFDPSELMARAIERFDMSGHTPESECERLWPKLRDGIIEAKQKANK